MMGNMLFWRKNCYCGKSYRTLWRYYRHVGRSHIHTERWADGRWQRVGTSSQRGAHR